MHEKGLIEIARNTFRKSKDVLFGPGEDDCAVIDFGTFYLVITTDMLHRETDFPDMLSPWRIGWMSVAVNLSDIAAMGAKPLFFCISIGFPEDFLTWIREMMEGMEACASKYNVSIITGDLDRHDELTLVGTAIGSARKDRLITREGARVGDLLCVTGLLGEAAAAIRTYNAEMMVPNPRVEEGISLAESNAVTSMTDISDGLATSAYDLVEASKVGFDIKERSLPIPDVVRGNSANREDTLYLALHYGGDYELLFTVDPGMKDEIKVPMTVIGEVIDERGVYLDGVKLEPKGYRHF